MIGFSVDPEVLRQRSPDLAGIAEAINQIEPMVTGAITDPDVVASAVLSPDTALRAEQALIHAVTNSAGAGGATGRRRDPDAGLRRHLREP